MSVNGPANLRKTLPFFGLYREIHPKDALPDEKFLNVWLG
jgi:hypothetical protein